MRKLVLTTVVILAAQGCLAVAVSAQTLPPGNSGIDQYTENVPAAGGNQPTQGGGGGGGGTAGGGGGSANPASGLSTQAQSRLDRLGKNGTDAARAAQASNPVA